MSADELVAVYDETGAVLGSAPRGEVRRTGRWHAAGVVFVRSLDGAHAYVHLRSPDKDVFPDMYDCWAGGVVAANESPAECAARELDEELGIRGVRPVPLFRLVFDEPPVRCHNFAFEVRWGGAITHQPEEIVDGRWMPLTQLRAWAEEPASPLAPDARFGVLQWFRRYG